jgi:hypothetical protein
MTLSPKALALVAMLPLAVFLGQAVAAEPTGVSSDLERTANTTPEEKLAYAASANQEIADALRAMDKMYEQSKARGEEGADGAACISKKRLSVAALQTVSTAAETQMKTYLNTGAYENADHEYRKIAVAVTKTRILLAEAQQCATGSQLESGTTLVDWESALQDDDQLLEPDIDDLDIDVAPPAITPFQ